MNKVLSAVKGTASQIKTGIAARARASKDVIHVTLVRAEPAVAGAQKVASRPVVARVINWAKTALKVNVVTAVAVNGVASLLRGNLKTRFKSLFTDWRNNHRRLANMLWNIGALVVAGIYYDIFFQFLFFPSLAVIVIAAIWSIGRDIHNVYKHGETMAQILWTESYRSLFNALSAVKFLIWDFPVILIFRRPAWFNRFVYRETPLDETVAQNIFGKNLKDVTDEDIDDAINAGLIGTGPITQFDSEDIFTRKPDQSDEVNTEAANDHISIVIDGEAALADPKGYGSKLREEVASAPFVEQQRFRKGLARKLRKVGLEAREVTFVLQGYDMTVVS